MKGEYIGRVGVYGRGWCIYIFTEYVPSKRGTAEAGGWWRLADGEEGAQLAGVDMRAGAVG